MDTLKSYVRQDEHDAIAKQVNDYLSRGGTIQSIPNGASGLHDGVYGSLARQTRKNKPKALPDITDEEEEA